MISRYEAWFNDVPLSSVDPDILLLDISYDPVQITDETFTTAKRHGARVHRRYVGESSCTVSFQIRKYSIVERQEVCAAIARWAKGYGVLKTNDRPGQRFRCVVRTYPNIASALRWLDTVQITFVAYALPFWEEEEPTTLLLSGIEAQTSRMEGQIYVPGNVDGALIEAHVEYETPASARYLTLSANGRTMRFTNLNTLTKCMSIDLTYDDEMIQRIVADDDGTEVSILDKRSGPDDLLALGGEENLFAYNTMLVDEHVYESIIDATFKVRGLWL